MLTLRVGAVVGEVLGAAGAVLVLEEALGAGGDVMAVGLALEAAARGSPRRAHARRVVELAAALAL